MAAKLAREQQQSLPQSEKSASVIGCRLSEPGSPGQVRANPNTPDPQSRRLDNTTSQAAETRNRLAKNLIDLYIGKAEILPNSERADGEPGKIAVRVCRPSGCVDIPADHVCIATGSR